ncbi:MAG: alpha/beta fold hydrolase [Saprospiraceae bacterium]|nr:alpha/beta fold hydrolase [Saprospiraceae bacterium]
MHPSIKSQFIKVEHLKLHYLEMGSGEPILLLHGWPTSSYLWRNLIPTLAENNRVIALDLPGFGRSDKRLSDSFSFPYQNKMIDSFLKELGIEKVNLAVHDLGGPLGLFWAVKNPEKVMRITFLNTLVYPEFSWAVKLFGLSTLLPGVKTWLTSPRGLRAAMRLGIVNKDDLSKQDVEQYQRPFQSKESRKVLLKTVHRLSIKGYHEIAEKLPKFKIPIQIIYGKNDKILPDVAKTMARVKQDLPQAELIALDGCGHFLQEDKPQEIALLMATFLQN